jgi:hypothetical protein
MPRASAVPMPSTNHDLLAVHLARGHITQAQYLAAQEFRKHFAAAADGDPLARKWLAKCYRELGIDGSALVHSMLIGEMTAKQVAGSRGLKGPDWQRFYARRLWECLNTLSAVYGFSNEDRRSKGAFVNAVRAAELRRV